MPTAARRAIAQRSTRQVSVAGCAVVATGELLRVALRTVVDHAGTFVGASSGSADRPDTPKIGMSIDLPLPSASRCTDAAVGSKAANGSVTRASLIPGRRGTGRRWRAHYNAGDRPQP